MALSNTMTLILQFVYQHIHVYVLKQIRQNSIPLPDARKIRKLRYYFRIQEVDRI